MAIKDYSTTPDMNTTISGINIAEGCLPSGINNAIRQLMADVKEESEAQSEAYTALRALVAQEVEKCLSLIGGTMSGPIVGSVNIAMRSPNSSGRLLFLGGTSTSDGAYLGLYGADNGSVGRARLVAVKGDATTELMVKTNGTASINNNDIFTSAGGVMQGEINFNHYTARNLGAIEMQPRTGSNIGGYIDFNFNGSAQDYTARIIEAQQGVIDIEAAGGVRVNGKPGLTLVASWSDGSGNWYRKYSDGLVMQRIVRPDTTGAITINLHTPMTDNTYFVVPSFENATGGEISVSELKISSKTNQSFVHDKLFADRGTVSYIVIGY